MIGSAIFFFFSRFWAAITRVFAGVLVDTRVSPVNTTTLATLVARNQRVLIYASDYVEYVLFSFFFFFTCTYICFDLLGALGKKCMIVNDVVLFLSHASLCGCVRSKFRFIRLVSLLFFLALFLSLSLSLSLTIDRSKQQVYQCIAVCCRRLLHWQSITGPLFRCHLFVASNFSLSLSFRCRIV